MRLRGDTQGSLQINQKAISRKNSSNLKENICTTSNGYKPALNKFLLEMRKRCRKSLAQPSNRMGETTQKMLLWFKMVVYKCTEKMRGHSDL